MQVRAILIDCVKISELRIPNTLLTLQKFLGPEMDVGWVSDTTQVVFCPANGAGHFCLPGGLKLAKAIIIDYADGQYRDVSWSVSEVAARVRWGEGAQTGISKPALKPKRARVQGRPAQKVHEPG